MSSFHIEFTWPSGPHFSALKLPPHLIKKAQKGTKFLNLQSWHIFLFFLRLMNWFYDFCYHFVITSYDWQYIAFIIKKEPEGSGSFSFI